ncbi:MAG TPA: pilin [Candidatus Paceibacterota bacterium]|nr:pilin [Candidatus Paceibacterota bacterium]
MKHRAALIIFGIAFMTSVAAPLHANAALFSGHIVPDSCQCDNQSVVNGGGVAITTAPDWGCVLATIQNLISFGVLLATTLFTIYLVITGFSFITSAGSSEARSKAKTRFANVFIGLAVMLCAWLIVDFVMKSLFYDQAKFGPWNSILAGSGTDQCIVSKQPSSITTGQLTSIVQPGTGTTGSNTGGGTGGYTGTGFTYQGNVQNQVPAESPQLAALLSCMAGRLPAGVGQISAITEIAIANGSKTMQQCALQGCAHTANSCHYGGRTCVGKSYAVDFGDEQNATALRTAARACDPNAGWNYEGNHVHISVGAQSGCGCDAGIDKI